jgi:hypothetical protein
LDWFFYNGIKTSLGKNRSRAKFKKLKLILRTGRRSWSSVKAALQDKLNIRETGLNGGLKLGASYIGDKF